MQNNVYAITLDDEYLRTNASYDKAPDILYRVKGFNSLVFDAQGLDKLTPLDEYLAETKLAETEIDAAREEGWQLARKIIYNSSVDDLITYGLLEGDVAYMKDLAQDEQIFSIFNRFTYAEAKAKIDNNTKRPFIYEEGDVIWNASLLQYGIMTSHLADSWFTVKLLDAVKDTGDVKCKIKDYDVWDVKDCLLFSRGIYQARPDTHGWEPKGK